MAHLGVLFIVLTGNRQILVVHRGQQQTEEHAHERQDVADGPIEAAAVRLQHTAKSQWRCQGGIPFCHRECLVYMLFACKIVPPLHN
jgi:hypothetical protein